MLLAVAIFGVCQVLLSKSTPASDSSFHVVVHPSRSGESITTTELSNIFLKRRTQWSDGSRIQAVDNLRSSPVRQAFSRAVHGRTVAAIVAYWQKQIFSGRSRPLPELSEADVLGFVKENEGAIGYVSSQATLEGVSAIVLVDESNS